MLRRIRIIAYLFAALPWALLANDDCTHLSEQLFEASFTALRKAHLTLMDRRTLSQELLEEPLALADVDGEVERLLQEGADPNAIVSASATLGGVDVKLATNTTSLHVAALSGWESLTEALLRHGGDPLQPARNPKEIVEGWGVARESPLDIAMANLIELYGRIEGGESISDGVFSAQSVLRQVKGVLLQLLRALPDGADVSSGFSGAIDELLFVSLKNADNDILQELFKHGISADGTVIVRKRGTQEYVRVPYTSVAAEQASLKSHFGSQSDDPKVESHLQTLRLLLDSGADPSIALVEGEPGSGEATTLLHIAAYFGDEKLVNFLLAKGLSPDTLSFNFRSTPKQVALLRDHHRVAQILHEWSKENSPSIH